MSKIYVVCIDGTWNHPGQTDKDPVHPAAAVTATNVLKMYEFLTGVSDPEYGTISPLQPPAGQPADADAGEVIYLNGVGTAGTVTVQTFEGSTGTGTSERIRDAYRFLCVRHRKGDRIFIFGFSRGAFAARSLAGFLQFVGLPPLPRVLKEEEIIAAYLSYRNRGAATKGRSFGRDATVDFLGVWDTVGALAFGASFNNFHNISPGNVMRIAHALALDEQREAFQPSYWEAAGNPAFAEEVWFAGAHSNVGGGYAETGLSNIALWWLISKAMAAGLPGEPDYAQAKAGENVADIVRDSYTEFFGGFGVVGRIVELFKAGKIHRSILDTQKVHSAVFDRISQLAIQTPPETYLAAARLQHGDPLPSSPAAFGVSRVEPDLTP